MRKTLIPLGLVLALLLPGQALSAAVSFNPASATIVRGQTADFSLELSLAPEETLYGFDFTLTWDPSVLGILEDGGANPFNSYVTFDLSYEDYEFGDTLNAPGMLSFNGFFAPLDPGESPLTGAFSLGSLSFKGTGLGSTLLDLSGDLDLGLMNTEGQFILTPVGTQAAVDVVSEPGTLLLLGSGLAGLLACGRKKNRAG